MSKGDLEAGSSDRVKKAGTDNRVLKLFACFVGLQVGICIVTSIFAVSTAVFH